MDGALRIDPYRVIERLAAGGIGEVYLAQRQGESTPCVLKILLDSAVRNQNAVRRFQREAHVSSYLEHPLVARTIDAGHVDGRAYIAMEYVPGVDLELLLQDAIVAAEPIPLPMIVAFARRALEALAYIHDARGPDGTPLEIVHRDLSPRNLRATFDGRLKVIDFGIAHADVGDFATASGVLMGTPRYLAPEQAAGDSVDRRADLYAVSVVLFELLSARRLVAERPVMEMVRAVIVDPAPALPGEVPKQLANAVRRGLEKAPDQRFADATAYLNAFATLSEMPAETIAAELRRRFADDYQSSNAHVTEAADYFAEHGGVEDRLLETHAAVDPPDTRLVPRPSTSADVAQPSTKNRWLWLALMCAVAAAALYLSWSEPEPSLAPSILPPPVVAAPRPSVRAVDRHERVPAQEPRKTKTPTPIRRTPKRQKPATSNTPTARAPSRPAWRALAERLRLLEARSREMSRLDTTAIEALIDEIERQAGADLSVSAAVESARACLGACDGRELIESTRNAIRALKAQRGASSADAP